MIVTQDVQVHLDKQTPITVETVQSDTGRGIRFFLFSNGKAFLPREGVKGIVRYSICHEGEFYTSCYDTLPDGSEAVVCYGTHLTVYLTPEIFSVVGVGQLQVSLLYEGEVVTTMTVLLRVQRDLSMEGMTPEVRTDMTRFIQSQVDSKIQAAFGQDYRLDALHQRQATAYTIGTLSSGDGSEESAVNHIRSGYIPHGGRELTVTLATGLKARCFFYDRNFDYVSESVFQSESFILYNRSAYVRIVACYADEREISDVEALAGQVGLFYWGYHRGSVLALGYGSFEECTAEGYYRFRSEDLSQISDAPAITAGGILEVHTHGADNQILQILHTTDNQIWSRWGNQPFRRQGPQQEPLKWYALGDGITQGYYSQLGGAGGLNPSESWTAVAALENGWKLTNFALHGVGYVQASMLEEQYSARDYVDNIDFSGAELVTLSFGVNDWMNNCPLGSMSDDVQTGGTFYSNMRYCIEKILMEQPCAKVVVISPINSSAYGTVGDNWGAGFAFAGGTLEDFYQAQKTVCAYYGIQFVDMLHESVVNRLNTWMMLPDGIHPSPACHRLLGIELARKLL